MTLADFRLTVMPQFESYLREQLATTLEAKDTIFQSMDYSVAAGGKRIRPMLLLATLQALNVPVEQGFSSAAALEYIHTYSLIHDDLPAMDDDDLRRGKPTNHKVYGEAIAILAGDGLLTFAFELLGKDETLSASKRIALMTALASAAGPKKMVQGQVLDMEGEKQALTLAELQNIHQKKTGALISFAVEAAAIIAEASEDITVELLKYANHFGLAFQIKDDILDIIGDETILGKKTGMDQLHDKNTYPSLLTLEGAVTALEKELMAAENCLTNAQKYAEKQGIVMNKALLEALLSLLR
ncbi:polyprenyl synthetase family protein [Isobaculum melis]|uniref:Farnesyl diphosphate synthase n=1 Tax=Isobaculum melis TaxID=142588 RepID=A0A1H9TWV8_9LACT|nr:farnesyl diphosphate synthase [Isobaculum melis]SES01616.1 farnesyl-diphosphate synthase [Isobaculum melis]